MKPAADHAVHGQQVSLPTRVIMCSAEFWVAVLLVTWVQMTWVSPIFPGQDHNSDVT